MCKQVRLIIRTGMFNPDEPKFAKGAGHACTQPGPTADHGRDSQVEQGLRMSKGRGHTCTELLVRYEKLAHSYLALNPLAAAIIALRKIRMPINIIYG